MFNVYRRISQITSRGTKVLMRKTRINGNAIDGQMVGEWFKNFAENLALNNDVRAITTTAFSVGISLITKDGKRLIYEYWEEATK